MLIFIIGITTECDNVVQLKKKMVGNSDNILLPIKMVHPGGQN